MKKLGLTCLQWGYNCKLGAFLPIFALFYMKILLNLRQVNRNALGFKYIKRYTIKEYSFIYIFVSHNSDIQTEYL